MPFKYKQSKFFLTSFNFLPNFFSRRNQRLPGKRWNNPFPRQFYYGISQLKPITACTAFQRTRLEKQIKSSVVDQEWFSRVRLFQNPGTDHKKMNDLKGTQIWIFFVTFFAENETLWSQGPVTRDFWQMYWISAEIFNFETFSHMLSKRWNPFRVCSASDEIHSAYAQHGCTSKNCSHFTDGWACAKSRSSYAQCAIKSFPRMLSVR